MAGPETNTCTLMLEVRDDYCDTVYGATVHQNPQSNPSVSRDILALILLKTLLYTEREG